MRYFSPSVDMGSKSIIGGSLTNWPASKKNGKNLMRPIELSTGVYSFETSLDERMSKIYSAFMTAFPPAEDSEESDYMIREVFDGFVIVESASDGLFKATFTEDETGVVFQPQAEWVKVKIAYEEIGAAAPAEDAPADVAPADAAPAADPNMSIPAAKLAELSEAQIASLVDERVNVRVAELARKADRARDTLALSERLCNGTKETPIGLAVPPADLCEILLSLPDENAKKITALLEGIVRVGVVNFSERGHSRIVETKQELPAPIARLLKMWTGAGKKADEFFTANPELALNSADYNLSEYQPKDK